jgi:phosphohistidine phosphatase
VKNLYLLRHAKSSWDDPSLSDGERPLNGRGRRDAPRMGQALGARLVPMTFYVSPTERAQQTFRAVQRNWNGLKKRHGVTTPALYTFDYREVLDWISQQPDELERAALVGHNPAFTDLVNYFVGPDTLENLPTAGWAELMLPIDNWSQVAASEGEGELVYLLFPKELGGAD